MVFSVLAAVAFGLYLFGFLEGAGRETTTSVAIGTIVPPPAPLVVATPVSVPTQPFGMLPPVQPFGDAPPFALAYERSGPFTGGAAAADVFRITWAKPSVAEVDTLARRLGIMGVVREKAGVFTATGNGTLTVEARGMTYLPPMPLPATTVSLTDERAAASAARGWLLARDLLPSDVGTIDVRYGGDDVDVIFHPRALPDLLSITPGVRVRLGLDGTIRGFTKAWPVELVPGGYELVSLDQAWAALPTVAQVELRLPSGSVNPPPDSTANVLIDNVSVAYAYASSGTGADYLQPMYVFRGNATVPGVGVPVPVRAAVPAVRDTKRPAG